jgi:hypothetical protein
MNLSKPAQDQHGPEWMIVYITYNVVEAHIIAGRLHSEDIPAMVHQEAGASAIGITLGRLGEVKVLVNPGDYERALAILETEADDIDALPDTTNNVTYYLDEDDDAE